MSLLLLFNSNPVTIDATTSIASALTYPAAISVDNEISATTSIASAITYPAIISISHEIDATTSIASAITYPASIYYEANVVIESQTAQASAITYPATISITDPTPEVELPVAQEIKLVHGIPRPTVLNLANNNKIAVDGKGNIILKTRGNKYWIHVSRHR